MNYPNFVNTKTNMEIINQLVSNKEKDAVCNLLQDDNSKLLLLKSLGQRLLQKDEIFIMDSIGQIILLIANAPFLRSEEECMQITNMVQWGIKRTNVLPMITEHKNKELAYRCLLSLGFFKEAVEKRTKYHGAPSVSFYRNIGINQFKNIGFLEISEDFQKWEYYLGEITC